MAFANEKIYTIEDIYNLPEGQQSKLVDGQIYNVSAKQKAPEDCLQIICM